MKVLVFLADGFEEVEALTQVDYLRRIDIKVDMVSITKDNIVKGAHGIKVIADKLVSELDKTNYDGVIIPGGMPGAKNLKDSSDVIDLVKTMYKDNKLVAAICAGPIVLSKADIIEGKNITSYPGFESKLKAGNYKEQPVVVDGNIITARGPYFAQDFALEIVDYLLGADKVKELKLDILYNKE